MRMPARTYLALIAAALAACSPHSNTGLAPVVMPPSDLTADQQVKQALNRLTYGPHPGDVQRVIATGLDKWLVQQLEPERIDDRAADSVMQLFPIETASVKVLADSFPPQDIFIRDLKRARGLAPNAPFVPDSADSARFKSLTDRGNRLSQQILAAKLARAVSTDRQLLEVMTDFWENHFSVFAGKMPTRFSLLEYDRDVIRPHALGRFRDLLHAVATSPEMLYYLDNWQSRADSLHLTLTELHAAETARTPAARERVYAGARRRRAGLNENYARELMELHTLGVDGGYTQHDVIEVARALTGWTIDEPRSGGGFVFRPAMHDAEPKVVLGHHLVAGRGVEDGEEVLDILARSPATARFVATKLVRHFVSDSVPPALVRRVAAAYLRTDGDIRQVLEALVTSPEFYSRAAYRAKVKTPYEVVVSTDRAMEAVADTTPRTVQQVAYLGQQMFGRLTPDGWPDVADAWINTGALFRRINFGVQAAYGRVPGISLAKWPPAAALRNAPSEQRVDGVVAALLEGEASPETRTILVSGRNPLAPPEATAMGAVRGVAQQVGALPLPDLVGLALGAPEFQRR